MAEECWLQAVENGNVSAMHNLGVLYEKQHKFSEAKRYLLMAKNNGHLKAMDTMQKSMSFS